MECFFYFIGPKIVVFSSQENIDSLGKVVLQVFKPSNFHGFFYIDILLRRWPDDSFSSASQVSRNYFARGILRLAYCHYLNVTHWYCNWELCKCFNLLSVTLRRMSNFFQDSFTVFDPKQLRRKGKERHIFLFEQALLFSKETKDADGKIKYLYKSKIKVNALTLCCIDE